MKLYFLLSFFMLAAACSSIAQRNPSNETKKMDLQILKESAFTKCQENYTAPKPVPIPMLDPPDGGLEEIGMAYQEELAVKTRNLLDQNDFYFSPRPRAAVNKIPMDIYVDPTNSGIYQLKTWQDADVDYTSDVIRPKINKDLIPPEGRVLTEIIIGHRSPRGDYPQLFDLRSSAYFRFAGYPPQVTGASMRLGAHRIAGLNEKNIPGVVEDFPVIRSVFASIKDSKTAQVLVLVESDLLCGALEMQMQEGLNSEVTVDSYWFTRKDFFWQKDPHTALVAYSSMIWKTEMQTPETNDDEAHDSDTVRAFFSNGKELQINLQPITGLPQVRDLAAGISSQVSSWLIANDDRNPDHYRAFAPYLGATNYPFRASYKIEILESSIKTGVSLYEMEPDKEYKDNIVVASTIREDFKKAEKVDDAIHFKYKTSSY